nr:glucan 1,3-beta-glucosidase [Quercus suber]
MLLPLILVFPLLAFVVDAVHPYLHVHGEIDIPEVDEQVHEMLGEYRQYTNYPGPSPSDWNRHHHSRPTMTAVPKPSNKCSYWMENIAHQGNAAFNAKPDSYQVFRNVKDFGAKGDGVSDDTAAINSAIASGGRCGPGSCNSTTVTPAVVYFPQGTYMINSSIIDFYYTQLIGNPNCLPIIRAFATFSSDGGLGLIDGDKYGPGGVLSFGATNVFWRQIRNFVIDMTLIPASSSATGIHWPTGQATSLQNVVFEMNRDSGTQHQGLFIESGSGGFMNDLIFRGGLTGAALGNQQFTFDSCGTAITQSWDWGWTYKSISITNCSIGLNMSSGGRAAQAVGSVTLIDSDFTDTPIGILTAHDATSQPATAGSLILENVRISNVGAAVQGPGETIALAGSKTNAIIAAWGEGHGYTSNGPNNFEGPITPNQRPANLLQADGKYYERSKPQYEHHSLHDFLSARTLGAKGDGQTDDTRALQYAIVAAQKQQKILYLDHGDYLISRTIYIPAGSKIVGESYSVILSHGQYFNDWSNPKPVVQLGKPGESGSIEWSDTIVSTRGQQRGAVLIEYNLQSLASSPSGLWDVHTRIGGFAGSELQLLQCPTTPSVTITAQNLDQNCIAAFMAIHVTKPSTGLYLENVWLWTADHDVEDPLVTQITIYAGRGILVESEVGPTWLVGTAVEHFTLYQYQFLNTGNVFAGQIQTETPYYQPNPSAPLPFPHVASLSDPSFSQVPAAGGIPQADAWGLRIVNSEHLLFYGAGLYSFFSNYSVTCSNQGNGETCQNRIFELDSASKAVSVYNLNTVGTHNMIVLDDRDIAFYGDNLDGFVDTIALFRSG